VFGTEREILGSDEGPGPQSLTGIVVAIARHRRRMAHFLEGLDGLERPVAGGGLALAEGTDASTLVANLAGRLRLDDAQLERLAEKLDEQVPHAHADEALRLATPSPHSSPRAS
jgi:hypothetical protein